MKERGRGVRGEAGRWRRSRSGRGNGREKEEGGGWRGRSRRNIGQIIKKEEEE